MKLLVLLLKFFSKKILAKYQPAVIGITGSVGKSSAKEAIASVLDGKFKVRASAKNYNNELGVPLTIIGFSKSPGHSVIGWLAVLLEAVRLLLVRDALYPEMLVLEMGADKPGDISYLTTLAPCTVGVLTAVAHAHTAAFKTIKKIAQEKRVIISHLPHTGYAVLNFDNPIVMENASVTKAEIITYGFKEGADVRASDVTIITDENTGWPCGLNFKVTYKGSTVPAFLDGIMTESYIYAALSAVSVGVAFGINLVDATQRLSHIHPLAGHMRTVAGIKKTLLIDDTYNSSPDAVIAALRTLSKIALRDGARRFAVLGDMLELGDETENLHRSIGLAVAEYGVDELVTVGEASKHTAAAAREAGLDAGHVNSFDKSADAGKYVQEKLKEGDVILVKGSQGSRMEKVVKELMAEPLDAEKLLVRQTPDWLVR